MTKPAVAIVDPYEAGALYAPLLADRGFLCHRVASHPPLTGDERRGTLRRQDFATEIDLAAGFEAAVAGLARLRVMAVLAGHEHGVPTADRLVAALGLPGNDLARSIARRDKAEMAALAAAAGLRVPEQLAAFAPAPLLAWARARDRWPVVAKPTRGYGSQQVERCATPEELEAALGRIFDSPNALGETNTAALAQEALAGPEYAIDTVSWNGEHRLSALWLYHRPDDPRRGPVPLFAAKELLPAVGEPAARLVPFVFHLLDALGIRFGPAHSEVMLVDGEPVLIEVGARLHGGEAAHTLARLASGESQVERMVRCLAEDGLGHAEPSPGPTGRAAILVLRNPHPGRAFDAAVQSRLASLPGVAEVRWNAGPGEPAPTIAGLVLLVDPDGERFVATERVIRGLEKEELLGGPHPRPLSRPSARPPGRGAPPPGPLSFRPPPLQEGWVEGRERGTEGVRVLHSPRAIADLAPAWDALLDRSACNRAFSSAAWFESWCEVAPAWEPTVLVARRDGEIAGILALVRDEKGGLRFPGDLADYQDAVVADDDLDTAAELLAAARDTATKGAGGGLSLACLRPDSHLARALARAPGRALQIPDGTVPCPWADLSAGYAAYLASRGGGFRSQVRRAWRRAEAAGLDVSELTPETLPPAELPALFLGLHGARFARSCFDRPLDRAFAHVALPRLFAERRLRAFAARAGGETIAISLCMVGERGLGYWNGGWRASWAAFSPGKLLLDLEIRTACAEGLAELDLMRGEEPYKAGWATGLRDIASWEERAP